MQVEFTRVIVGVLLGIGGTLAGTVVSFLLTVVRDRAIQTRELLDSSRALQLELEHQLDKLNPEDVTNTIDTSVYEVFRAKNLLAQVPTGLATKIVRSYELLSRINSRIEKRDSAILAIIQARERYSIAEYVEEIRNLKAVARTEVESTVGAIRSFVANRS